jgi:hypothetical protein
LPIPPAPLVHPAPIAYLFLLKPLALLAIWPWKRILALILQQQVWTGLHHCPEKAQSDLSPQIGQGKQKEQGGLGLVAYAYFIFAAQETFASSVKASET